MVTAVTAVTLMSDHVCGGKWVQISTPIHFNTPFGSCFTKCTCHLDAYWDPRSSLMRLFHCIDHTVARVLKLKFVL